MTATERAASHEGSPVASGRPVPRWLVVASVPAVIAVIVVGVWLAGSVTTDANGAKLLTVLWFAVAGLAAAVIAYRWRAVAVPVLVTFVLTGATIGGYLLYTSSVNRVVNEQVIVANSQPSGGGPKTSVTGPIAVASGAFTSQAHDTTGKATVIKTPNGKRILTLTNFSTAPGPDLRVYVVPGDGTSTKGSLDLGRLKGNIGNQQYELPSGAPTGAVIIWCRSFSVAFGAATLA